MQGFEAVDRNVYPTQILSTSRPQQYYKGIERELDGNESRGNNKLVTINGRWGYIVMDQWMILI